MTDPTSTALFTLEEIYDALISVGTIYSASAILSDLVSECITSWKYVSFVASKPVRSRHCAEVSSTGPFYLKIVRQAGVLLIDFCYEYD